MKKIVTKDGKIKRTPRLFFTGFSMGLADLVPGVSGGTIAFIFGIYEELLYSIKLVTGQVPKLILQGQFKNAIALIPFGFLLPVFFGIIIAIFGFVKVVSFLLESYPIYVWSFFFGLVLGSVYIISRRIKKWTIKRIILLIVGFIFTYIIIGLPSLSGSSESVAIFFTGAIAITAMILPGISGSLIMVLIGQYEIIINAVSDRDYLTIFVFAAGAIIGLALFVRLLTWLLKHYQFAVIATLIGVMAGSLRRVWPWQAESSNGNMYNIIPDFNFSLILAIALIVFGFALVYILERIGIAKEHDDIKTKEFIKEFN